MKQTEKKVSKREILLESGTNEVEIAEFILGTQSFGVNVAKIKEFVPYEKTSVTKIPNAPPSMIGVFLLRGKTIPLINLNMHLERHEKEPSERPVVLVTEFNKMVNGFVIDAINQIHRLSWNDIKPLNPILKKHTTRFTGTVHIKNSEILILDLEFIISEIFPKKMESLMNYDTKNISKALTPEVRSTKRIIIAEDSTVIRKVIKDTLDAAGYHDIHTYDNGQDACDAIEASIHNGQKSFDLLISDIEMPKMDGLTLCKNVRQALKQTTMPIVMFSSLINEQMARKCDSVGATAHVTKPDMGELLKLIDGLIFGK